MHPVRIIKEFLKKGDAFLLALCVITSGIGLLLIYSATNYMNFELNKYVIKQAAFICVGIALYFGITFVDVESFLEKWWRIILLAGIFIILLIIPFGVEDNTGNRSWIYFPHIPVGIQPGEIVKLVYIMVMAWLLNHERRLGVSRVSSVIKYLALTALFAGLLAVLSSDYGMVLVYLLLFIILTWVGGINKWWFIGVGGTLSVAVVFLWKLILPRTSYWTDYRIMRFRVVLDHTLDPQGIGWQQSRSLLAIGSGGLTGMGFLQGRQTQSTASTNLPARHTDFIFAVCGEEFGLIGCCIVLALLFAIIIRCIWVSRRARSHVSAYMAIGFAGMLMVQTILNVGMCLYVAPVIGLTLPFISYGGSSTVTLFIAMGIVSSIKMRPMPNWLKDRSEL